MMNKKNMRRLTVMLVICAMLMNGIALFPVSAEEANPAETFDEEIVSVEKALAGETEAEEPTMEEPIAGKAVAGEPVAEEPAVEEPVAEKPAAEEPVVEEPVVEKPVAEEPVVEKPAAEEPVVEEPAAEEPAAEEPVVEKPAAEEPVAEKPAVEEPVAGKPAVEEPAAEKPAVEEPVAEKPADEKPAAEASGEDEKEFTRMFVNGAATVYENPEEDEEHEICKMQDGEAIEVCKYNEDWYEVKTGGYIMKESLRPEAEKKTEGKQTAEKPTSELPVNEKPTAEAPAAEVPAAEAPAAEETLTETPSEEEPEEEPEEEKVYTWMFVNGNATVYAIPEAAAENAVCEMQNGDPIRVCEYNEDWYKLKAGYIMKSDVCSEARPETAEEETAQEPAAETEILTAEASAEESAAEASEEQDPAEESFESFEDYETPLGIPGQEAAPVYEYERDENGALVLDENGNPIVIRDNLDEDDEIPVAFLRDENGELVLDNDGNPIVTQTVPADAVIVNTLEDALNPDRTIDIYYSWNNKKPAIGGDVTFIAVLRGYENLEYTIQWQQSKDNANWSDIDEANEVEHLATITRDNYRDFWRIQVTITDIEA